MRMGIRRKVKKCFALDERSYEIIRGYTRAQGISMSSWLTALLNELAKQIQGQPSPFDKPVGQMTIDEITKMMLYWKEAIEMVERGEEKAPKD